jgi:hypothetical protein
MVKDEEAVAIMTQVSADFEQIGKIRMFAANIIAQIVITCESGRSIQGLP